LIIDLLPLTKNTCMQLVSLYVVFILFIVLTVLAITARHLVCFKDNEVFDLN